MKIYFATQLSPDVEQVNTLTSKGGRKLVSYSYLCKERKETIKYFLKTGRNKKE